MPGCCRCQKTAASAACVWISAAPKRPWHSACAGIVIGGVPITLLDTAGLRQSADVVEQIGVQRSWAAARQADIVLMVADASGAGWTRGDADIFDQIFDDSGVGGGGSNGSGSGGGGQPPALLVLNKVDLAQQQQQAAQQQQLGSERGAVVAAVPEAVRRQFAAVVATSASTLEGLPELRQAMLQLAGAPEVRLVWPPLAAQILTLLFPAAASLALRDTTESAA